MASEKFITSRYIMAVFMDVRLFLSQPTNDKYAFIGIYNES